MTSAVLGQARDFLLKGKYSELSVGVIGDVAIDVYVQGSVDRISPEAPVPVLLVEKSFEKLGCAANVVENLLSLEKNLQLKVQLLSVVGQDEAGDKLKKILAQRSTQLGTQLITDATRPTIQKTRFIAGTQHQLLRVDFESSRALDAEVEAALLAKIDQAQVAGWIVQDYAKGLLSPNVMARLVENSKKRKIPLFIDPHRNTPPSRYRGATLITPNVAESEALLGGRSLHKGRDDKEVSEACAELKEKLDLEMLLMTRSQYGMTLLDKQNKIHHFPALSRAVFDVTGAGDTVVALFVASVLRGASLELAGTLATAAASVVVGKVGAATASVDEILAELEHFPI